MPFLEGIVSRLNQTLSDGAPRPPAILRGGEVGIADTHGRYQEAVLRGNVFLAARQSGGATQAGLSSNSSCYALYNPFGSGKVLSILDITVAQTAVLGAAAYVAVWLAGNTTQTQTAPATNTAITVQNALLGSTNTGVGVAYSQTTLAAAPVVLKQLGQTFFGTAAVTEGGLQIVKDEVAGSICLLPGTYVSIQSSAAVTLAAAMTWEEILYP